MIAEIEVNNTWGKVLTPLPVHVFEEIRNDCSYVSKQTGYYARKRGFRPQPVYRFKKDQSFRVGLLNRVRNILRKNGIYSSISNKSTHKVGKKIVYNISPFYSLRSYQTEAVQSILDNEKAAIEIATGGGKTVIMGGAIAKLGVKTTIITNSTILLYQTARALEEMLGTEIGIVGDSIFNPKHITVAMVQSLDGATNEEKSSSNKDGKMGLIESTEFLIVDECHRIAARVLFDLSGAFSNARYGAFFSATIRRLDGRDLDIEAATGPIRYSMSMRRLIDSGNLVDPTVYYYDVSPPLIPPKNASLLTTKNYDKIRKFYIDDYDYRNKLIADIAEHLVHNGHLTLISVRHIEHGNKIKALLPSACEIYSETDGRVSLFNKFKKGAVPIVISTLCKEGWDAPHCSAVVIAHDSSDVEQIVGRVVRPYINKRDAIVVHLVDSHNIFKKHIKSCEKLFYKVENIRCIPVNRIGDIL